MHSYNKIVCVLFLTLSTASAGAAAKLTQFFEKLGGAVNHTGAGSFHDQQAGYYTGGGYVMRQGSTTVQPINVSMPNLGIGCNNIDLYLGSLSFMKGDAFSGMIKQMGTGMATYGFQLALKTTAPQLENLMSQLRKHLQDMNNLMLNSCQASQQIVGGLWPKGTAASEQICMDAQRDGAGDVFNRREHCKSAETQIEARKAMQNKYKDLLSGEYNLVWHVMQKMPAYQGAGNKELAEFIMTLVGTLIAKAEGGRIKTTLIEPRADQKDFIGAYLKGGTTSLLSCRDDTVNCLSPALIQTTISDEIAVPHGLKTMKAKVWGKINELRIKYLDKTVLTQEDMGFLNDSVHVPVYKYIQVSVASGSAFLMADAAEYIAAVVLLTQFERIAAEILEAIDSLQKVQLEGDHVDAFKNNLQHMRTRLQSLLVGAQSGSIMALNQTIQAIERSIITMNS